MPVQLQQISSFINTANISDNTVLHLNDRGNGMLASSSWGGRFVALFKPDANRATAQALLNAFDRSRLLDGTSMDSVRNLLSDSLERGRPLTARVVKQAMENVYAKGVQLQNSYQAAKAQLTSAQQTYMEAISMKPLTFRTELMKAAEGVRAELGQIASFPVDRDISTGDFQRMLHSSTKAIMEAAVNLPELPEGFKSGEALSDLISLAALGDTGVAEAAFEQLTSPVGRYAVKMINQGELFLTGQHPDRLPLNQLRSELGNALGVEAGVLGGLQWEARSSSTVLQSEVERGLNNLLNRGEMQVDGGLPETSYVPHNFVHDTVQNGTIALGYPPENPEELAGLSLARRSVANKDVMSPDNALELLGTYFGDRPELGVGVSQLLTQPLGWIGNIMETIPQLSHALQCQNTIADVELRDNGTVFINLSTTVRGLPSEDYTEGTLGMFDFACQYEVSLAEDGSLAVRVQNPRMENYREFDQTRL